MSDTILHEHTSVVIDPRVRRVFGPLPEERIRAIFSTVCGTELETRAGEKDKLLAELTRRLREMKRER